MPETNQMPNQPDFPLISLPNRSYFASGDYGRKDEWDYLKTVPNSLIATGHGSPEGLTNAAERRIYPDRASFEKYQQPIPRDTNLEELAARMGPMTNEIKRVFIEACFASGYTFPEVKRIFPNLEQLISPSPTQSVTEWPIHTLMVPEPIRHLPKRNLGKSLYYNITPTGTNVIRQMSDWAGTNRWSGLPRWLPRDYEDEGFQKDVYRMANDMGVESGFLEPVPEGSWRWKSRYPGAALEPERESPFARYQSY